MAECCCRRGVACAFLSGRRRARSGARPRGGAAAHGGRPPTFATASALDLAHVTTPRSAALSTAGAGRRERCLVPQRTRSGGAPARPNHDRPLRAAPRRGLRARAIGTIRRRAPTALARTLSDAGSVLGVGGPTPCAPTSSLGLPPPTRRRRHGPGAAEQAYARAVSIVGNVPGPSRPRRDVAAVGLAGEANGCQPAEKTRRDRTRRPRKQLNTTSSARSAPRAAQTIARVEESRGRARLCVWRAGALRRPRGALLSRAPPPRPTCRRAGRAVLAAKVKGPGARAVAKSSPLCISSALGRPLGTFQSASNGASRRRRPADHPNCRALGQSSRPGSGRGMPLCSPRRPRARSARDT